MPREHGRALGHAVYSSACLAGGLGRCVNIPVGHPAALTVGLAGLQSGETRVAKAPTTPAAPKRTGNIKLEIDVDPQSFL